MSQRRADGSAGDADYGAIGGVYTDYRKPDPRIGRYIVDALGDARTVLNVGAGAGGYEPEDREVTAVEPSASMRSQRPAHLSPAVDAVVEQLPFPDRSFEGAMSTFSVHQWNDLWAGLREMRRVTRGPVAILTCDPALLRKFWLLDYAPEVIETESRRYPSVDDIADGLGGNTTVIGVPIPNDCTDGFNEAYYARPGARLSCSAWSFVDDHVHHRFAAELRRDLDDGTWDRRYGRLREQPAFDGSLVLIVSRPED